MSDYTPAERLERMLNNLSNTLYFADEEAKTGDHLAVLGRLRLLKSLADATIEDTLVAQARADGHSWEAIGGALNMTRQAAHEKYARRMQDTP